MKKIIIAILMTFGIFSMVSADIGVKIGVTSQIGSLETSGKEVSSAGTTETSKTREAMLATAGYFIEKDLAFLPGGLGRIGSRIHIGYDNILHDLDLGTSNNVRSSTLGDAAGKGTEAAHSTHSLTAEVTGFETVYATVNITDWLYVKAGTVTVDVKTKFTGTATSKYANTHSLDGNVKGFGLIKATDTGWFTRLEYNDYDIDGKKVTNTGADSKFSATLNDVSGSTARLSFGKAF
tara:strand:+ start:774 stop:1481 length:708 start_codon:yes stop_codon:yes gene_type:complete